MDGSFISTKPDPGDFDTLLILDEGLEQLLAEDPAAGQLVNYTYCKENGWGDVFLFFVAAVRKFPHLCRLDVFDHDKSTWTRKGVVEVVL